MIKKALSSWILITVLFLLHPAAFGDLPKVHKVDPPSWWAGHSINPVQIVIRGEDFRNAKVVTDFGKVESIETNERGTYLILYVSINEDTQPGPHKIAIQTNEGGVYAPFEILEPLPREGRFQGFSSDDIVYLLMPDRFSNGNYANDNPKASPGMHDRKRARYYHGGDLEGVIDRLPYLKDLGVTAIWMNPIYDNVNRLNEKEVYDDGAITDYHGYGAVDFYNVDEHLGTLEMFRRLVDEAHENGIKIIQDQVANHTGPYHPWVSDSPTPTWYNGTQADHLANTWQTWTLADPHASYGMQRETLEGWFIDILPDLNQNDPETAQYLIQNTLWWIGVSGLDGIRQDTLPYVHRRFWNRWMKAIKTEYPNLEVVGEMFDGNVAKTSFFQGGVKRFDGIDSRIDGLFDFPLYYPVRRAFGNGESIRQVAEMLAYDWQYTDPNMLMTFLGLHDVSRFMNEKNASHAGLKLAYTFLMTARGIPLIYYGDEIGMPGGGDPDNRRDLPGGWREDQHNAFTEEGRTPEENEIYGHVQRLCHLRQELEPLRQGKTVSLYVDDDVYAYARVLDGECVLVVLNNSTGSKTVSIPAEGLKIENGTVWKDRLGNSGDISVSNKAFNVTMKARSGSVFVVK